MRHGLVGCLEAHVRFGGHQRHAGRSELSEGMCNMWRMWPL